MNLFKRNFPLLATSLVNKCGAIGLSLLPMLLVERALSSTDSALVMTMTKSAVIVGTLFGGWCCDRLGLKRTLLASFGLSALGLAFLPWGKTAWILGLLAVIAQVGQSMFNSAGRLLVTRLVAVSEQQESIGWLRAANNLGQIMSYSIGWIFSGWGIAALMLFDAATSVAAIGIGARLIPGETRTREKPRNAAVKNSPQNDAALLPTGGDRLLATLSVVLLTPSYSFLYDLYMIGAAASFRVSYGEEGLKIFSQLMVVNTALCAGFAVLASRWFKNPKVAFLLGLIFGYAGAALTFYKPNGGIPPMAALFVGIFLITLGEIVFMSVSSFVVIRLIPNSPRQGMVYSSVLVIQNLGRVLGASLAFPLIVHGSHPVETVLVSAGISLVLWVLALPQLDPERVSKT